jgi:hypothetical protein
MIEGLVERPCACKHQEDFEKKIENLQSLIGGIRGDYIFWFCSF